MIMSYGNVIVTVRFSWSK